MQPSIDDCFQAAFPGGGESATPAFVSEGQKAWQALNARVDNDKMEPDEVTREYLIAHGLVKGLEYAKLP